MLKTPYIDRFLTSLSFIYSTVFNEVARHKNYFKENPRFQGTCTRQTPDGRESEAMAMFNVQYWINSSSFNTLPL
jgi:hypothetical protein